MDYSLTDPQKKAFVALERAFIRCLKEKVLIWDDYGVISAVNGKIVRSVDPDGSLDQELDRSMVSTILEPHVDSNADDPLYINLY